MKDYQLEIGKGQTVRVNVERHFANRIDIAPNPLHPMPGREVKLKIHSAKGEPVISKWFIHRGVLVPGRGGRRGKRLPIKEVVIENVGDYRAYVELLVHD